MTVIPGLHDQIREISSRVLLRKEVASSFYKEDFSSSDFIKFLMVREIRKRPEDGEEGCCSADIQWRATEFLFHPDVECVCSSFLVRVWSFRP